MSTVRRFGRTGYSAARPVPRPRGWKRLLAARWEIAAGLVILTSASLITAEVFPTVANAAIPTRSVGLCTGAGATNCVIDGDTIRWAGHTIRLEDIDAPEIRDFKCSSELALGNQATERLRELMGSPNIELIRTGGRDEDRYGRKLRVVSDGQHSLGAILVAEGLARPWDGARRSWCT